ncbi:MAG: SCO family protein [Ginsengibacter sp.]
MKKLVSKTWFVVVLVIAIPLIAFQTVHWLENKYEALPVFNKAENLMDEDYHFENQKNEIKTFNDWKNKILVTDFFFTICPTICPKMTRSLKAVALQFGNDPKVQLLSFTVDPQHDSAAKLLSYSQNMDADYPNWDFLTGDKKPIYKLARKEFFVTATDGDGGPEDFIHSDKVMLIDMQSNIRGYYDGTSKKEIQQLIKDIKKLENER